jgi:hypothetical protein
VLVDSNKVFDHTVYCTLPEDLRTFVTVSGQLNVEARGLALTKGSTPSGRPSTAAWPSAASTGTNTPGTATSGATARCRMLFGLGFERILAYVTGLTNVRDAISFPRTSGNARY